VPDLIRPSTVLPAIRREITLRTEDGLTLVGEVATPEGERLATLVLLHPNPTGGGMMDSHVYKKAANRLPHMAGIEILRFNTRGTESERGRSEGSFENGVGEHFDVEAAIACAINELHSTNLWVVGWSFGTDLALAYARNPKVKGLILLSPPLRTSKPEDLQFWAEDGRPIIALIPEHDEYLQYPEAVKRFAVIPQMRLIHVLGAKHLWVGEPMVYRVLTEIVSLVAPSRLPLPTEV
jgi:uncharacterized protein